MRLYWVVLWIIVIFHGTDAVSVVRNDEHFQILGMSTSTITARRLRSYAIATTPDTNTDTDATASGEERTYVKGLSKLADLDKKTSKLRKLDMKISNKIWTGLGRGPDSILRYLRRYGDWVKIEENKRVIQWFRFVKDLRTSKKTAWSPDYKIYSTLEKVAEESKMAALFESLKNIPDLKNLAETMQNYQFKLWISRDETLSKIATMFGISTRRAIGTERDPRYEILDAFTRAFKAADKYYR